MYQFVVLIIFFPDCEYLSKERKEKYLIIPFVSERQSIYLSCLLIIYVTAKDQTLANVDISQEVLVNIKKKVNNK